MEVSREIIREDGEVFCQRSTGPEFRQLKDEKPRDERYDNGIRVYGSHTCAVLQLRAYAPITQGGKPRRMIATASHLDQNEVKALIEKLQEILPTLYSKTV